MLPSSELRPLSRPRSLSTPRREDLLAAFRASERVALGCVGAELAATVLLLAFAWGRLGTVPAWQSVSLFVAGAVGLFDFLLIHWAGRRTDVGDIADHATFGIHSGASLRVAVRDVCRRMGLGESRCRISLVPDKEINARALRVGLLPGLYGIHDVTLNRSILHLLDEDELKFVIGHELGHVFLYSPITTRCLLVHALFAGALSLVIGLLCAGSDWMIMAPVVSLAVTRWLVFRTTAAHAQRIEFLCDACGASVAGCLPAMTATIKMALEAEARARLLCRVMEAKLADDDIPMARLLAAYEASLPFGSVVPAETHTLLVERVRRLRNDSRQVSFGGFVRSLSGDTTDLDELRDAVKGLRRAAAVARVPVAAAEIVADPRRLPECVAAIEDHPERVLVGTEEEIDDSSQSHPSPSRRLLFLWREASAPLPAANDSPSRADRR